MVSFILPGNSATGGYQVANSLIFEGGDSASLIRTPSSATNQKTFTFSTWVKRITSGSDYILSAKTGTGSSDNFYFGWRNDQIQITSQSADGNTTNVNIRSNALFRDFSAWYHLVCAIDTTQGTSTDRVKLYVNGSQVTSLENTTYPSQNDDLYGINGTVEHAFGRENYSGGAHYHSYYLAETVLIDGSQLDPTSFGEFDEDSPTIWKPIDVSGLTFGTNGFYLDFEDSSSLGNDAAGSNNFTVSNLAATDQSTDTCTNNFAVLADHSSDDLTLTQGRLKFENSSSGHRMVSSTIAPSQGKWYAEIKMTTEAQSTRVGVIDPQKFIYNTYIHNAGRGYAYKGNDGATRFNDGTTDGSYGNTYTTGDIVGIAMDLDNHKLYFSKNGTFQNSGDPTSGSTGTGSAFDLATGVEYYIGASTQDQGTNPVIEFNFGSPSFSISSGNSDANGYGNFEYSVPSGYYSLNSKNLAEYG